MIFLSGFFFHFGSCRQEVGDRWRWQNRLYSNVWHLLFSSFEASAKYTENSETSHLTSCYKSIKWVGVSSGFRTLLAHGRRPENASHYRFIMKETQAQFYPRQNSCWSWPVLNCTYNRKFHFWNNKVATYPVVSRLNEWGWKCYQSELPSASRRHFENAEFISSLLMASQGR